MARPRLNWAALEAMPEGPEKEEAKKLIAELDAIADSNPLAFFEPHPKQRPFFEAKTSVVAAFAGNRFGKTTALTCRALIECLDVDWLPEHLRPYKRWFKDSTAPRGTRGRIVNPSFSLLDSVILPAFRQWTPAGALVGGSFDKAYKGAPNRTLSFANGSFIQFMTHEQDEDKFGGASLHFVGYDEPPPKGIRDECLMRLADFDGYEMFACTPLKVNVAWMRRDIYKKREAPGNTVIEGSIHDNPMISPEGKRKALEEGDQRLRPAREFGKFVNVGGLIYPEFERCVIPPLRRDQLAGMDVVTAIDPGIRNAAFIWLAFDRNDVGYVFDELLLQDQGAVDYALGILGVNARWGLGSMEDRTAVLEALRAYDVEGIKQADIDEVERRLKALQHVDGSLDPLYVIDPAARARGQVNAETMQSALQHLGFGVIDGQNDVEAGIGQVQTRLSWGRLKVCENCRGLRDEADDYAAEPRDDAVLKPIKGNDHRLDALRYGVMTHNWSPVIESEAPERQLGWEPGHAPPKEWFDGAPAEQGSPVPMV